MGLLEKAAVRQVRHNIANARWTKPLAIGSRQRTRTHWLARRNKGFDDGGQDFAFTFADRGPRRHRHPCTTWSRLIAPTQIAVVLPKLFRCNTYISRCKMHSDLDSRKRSCACQPGGSAVIIRKPI